MKKLYPTTATAYGPRRGRATTADGQLDVLLDIPELGGRGAGTNSEQLFAAGYSSCLHAALARVAKGAGVRMAGAEVTAHVSLVPFDDNRFGLEVRLEAWVPEVDAEGTLQLMEQAHQICPYSNATRGNITVQLALAEGARMVS
jgi:lipoyl-dependent peroxiredoxin